MENKNKIINQNNLLFLPGFIIPPLNEKFNLFENNNIIHYNGVTIPRIPFLNPIFMNPFIPPFLNNDINTYKQSIVQEKQPEIIIPINEKENCKSEIENEYSKKTDSSDLNRTEESKILNNNNLINNDKNSNIIKSLDFINRKESKIQQNQLFFNKIDNFNDGILKNFKNVINSTKQNQTNFTKFNHNPLNFKENQLKSNEKSSLKIFKIEEDISSISSSLNSKSDNVKNIKNLFVVNEVIKPEVKKEEIEIKNQNILISTKRGRKQNLNNNKKTHEATDDDNIHRKIQVHYISFITHFINDIIINFVKSRKAPLFKNIDYKLKKIVNQKYFQDLKSKKIADILKMRPSPKMKNHESFVNEVIYNKVCKLCPFLYEFLEQNFMTLFKDYYYNNKNKFYIVNGKQINISDKTKNFNDLINKNYAYKDKIKFIVLNTFFEDSKAFEKIRFKTNQEKNNEINNE